MLLSRSFVWRAPVSGALDNAGGDSGGRGLPPGQGHVDVSHSAYWPQHELDAFILQMAGHGRAVRTAMMLGDAAYAREQLAAAMRMDSPELHALSLRLTAYFERPACAGGANPLPETLSRL